MSSIGAANLMATVRSAVAEQRAAALSLDAGRLASANQRLTEALAAVQRHGVAEQPPESFEVASIQRQLEINAEAVARGAASGNRAVQAVADTQALYGQSGAPAAGTTVSTKPIAAA